MTRLHQLLTGALVVQVLLAALMWWPEGDRGVEPIALVAMEPEAITALEVSGAPPEDGTAEAVRLERRDDEWVIASAHDYPADPDKVDEVLGHLTELEVREPIATKATSHPALKVGEQEYGRKVRLEGGEQSVELVLGAAASKSVHVRRADASEVYEARGFSEWSIGNRPRSYWDPKVLEVAPDSLESLTIQHDGERLHLIKTEGGWTSPDLPEGMAIDATQAEELAKKVLVLRMSEPIAPSPQPEHGLQAGTRVEWSSTDGSQSVAGGYRIGTDLDSSYAFVKLDESPHVLKVAKSSLSEARSASLAELMVPEVVEP